MILDNARWHKAKKLEWGKIIPVFLPPYSPNLNAIEPLWKALKDRLPTRRKINNYKELQDILCKQLKYFINNPQEIRSTCKISVKVN